MIRSTLSYAVIFLFITGTAAAQITVTQSDIQNLLGQSYDVSAFQDTSANDLTTDLTTLASLKGANQTFDFTTIPSFFKSNPTITKLSFLKLPADLPGANNTAYANANIAIVETLSSTSGTPDTTYLWEYHQLKSDGFYAAGYASLTNLITNQYGQSPDTLILGYYPYKIVYKFPLTYQTTWKDTTVMTDIVGTSTEKDTVQTEAVVDGYGILKLPNTTANCLRIRGTRTTIFNTGSPQPKSIVGFIEYVTKSSGNTSAYIELDQNGNPIFASYVEPASSTTPIEKNNNPAIASDYRLNQNYPNPFNPSTVISYNLKQTGPVTLRIYNYLGELVATLANGIQAAGNHKVIFNAAALNSGLYFYRLQAGSFSQTRKMMLIK